MNIDFTSIIIDKYQFLKKIYQPSPQILEQLNMLGLRPTGSLEGDIAIIKKAIGNKEINDTSAAHPIMPPKTPVEMQTFMNSIGISATNSKEGDYTAVMSRLSYLQSLAKNREEQNEVKNLRSEFNTLILILEAQKPASSPKLNLSM